MYHTSEVDRNEDASRRRGDAADTGRPALTLQVELLEDRIAPASLGFTNPDLGTVGLLISSSTARHDGAFLVSVRA